MRIISVLVKAAIFAAEKISAELALLAALLSTTRAGEIWERVAGGMLAIFKALHAFGAAYARDMSFPEFMEGFRAGINSALDRLAANVEADPRAVLLGMLASYAFYKAAAVLLGLVRRRAFGKRRGTKGPAAAHRPHDRKGRTYEQLYDRPEPHQHHEHQAHTQG